MIDYRKLPEFFRRCFKVEDRFRPNIHVQFDPNSAQNDFLELCAKIQDQRQLVWVIAIKPRRVGLSRVMSGVGTALAYYERGLQGVVMAQLGSTLFKIMRSYNLMARGLPATRVKADRKMESIVIGHGKHPSVLTGAKALSTGEGRGDAAQFMQLTEAAHYPLLSPFTAMLPLVPQELNTFIGIESTPNPQRQGIAFREMWDEARWIDDKRRDTLFVRYFCPWMKDPYAVADAKIAKDAPIDDTERTLLKIGVGRGQLAWRRREIRGRYRGKVELFEQENPTDPLCIAGNTLISTDRGIMRVDEAAVGLETESGRISAIVSQGTVPVFRVTTKFGRQLVGTGEHRLLTANGEFVNLEDSLGSDLALRQPRFTALDAHVAKYDVPGGQISVEIDGSLARFLGYFLGDGSYSGRIVSITCDARDEDVGRDVSTLFDAIIGNHQERLIDDGGCREIRVGSVDFPVFMKAVGVWSNENPHRKVRVPDAILRSPKPMIREFLRGIFEADGSASKVQRCVSMASVKRSFLAEIQLLLLGFGIPSSLVWQPKRRLGGFYPCWCLKMYSLASQEFVRSIGFISARKREVSEKYLDAPKAGRAPEPLNFTDTVISVEPDGEVETFDLSIDDHRHTFSANGIAVHNSCFSQTEMPAFSLEEKAFARESALEWREKFKTGRLISQSVRHPIHLRFDDPETNPEERGDWRFYEEPQKNCEYYIGVDSARGIDLLHGDGKEVGDYSAAVVINGSSCAVAAVLETRVPPDDVAREVATAGRFYATREISEFHYAMLNIAITDGYGNEVRRRVRDEYNYPPTRFTRWRGRDDRIYNRPGTNVGWIDSRDTNQMRLDMLRIALAHRQLHIRDPRLAEQIQAASMTDSGDAEVVRGHDDIYDACSYAWVAREFDKPRVIVPVDQTDTALYRGLVKMSNDPKATAQRLWEQIGAFQKPGRPSITEEMLKYINETRH